jgi:DNA-binding NarL/FixJ family response regulator
LVLTAYDDAGLLPEAIAAGPRGYLLKDAALEELAAAIREAHTSQQARA